MSHPIAKPSNISNSRCQHRYAHGKRCRLSISNLDSAFCPIHSTLPGYETDSSEIAAALTANLSEFRSAVAVNDFLARLLLLLAQNRISPRKAAVLAYITNQLLRTLPAIDRELNPPVDPNERVQIIYDIDRPYRGPVEPKTQAPAPTSTPSLGQWVSLSFLDRDNRGQIFKLANARFGRALTASPPQW